MVCVNCESDGALGTGLSVVGQIATDRDALNAALALRQMQYIAAKGSL